MKNHLVIGVDSSNGWADPIFLDPLVNTGAGAGFPCVVRGGALVLPGVFRAATRDCTGRSWSTADWCGRKIAAFQPGPTASSGIFFVAPDESYIVILLDAAGQPGERRSVHQFRQPDGTWTEPRNLGPDVNTKGYDFAPSLSPDGTVSFFTRDEGGTGNVHWISTATFRSSDS